MRSVEKSSVKQYLAAVAVMIFAVLLMELICYPLNPSRLTEEADVKTTASIMILTDETPPELQIYHRALLLPRYRLDFALEVRPGDFSTANVDWYQICVVSVENHQIVLYAQEDRPVFLMAIVFFSFVNVIYYTMKYVRQKARNTIEPT